MVNTNQMPNALSPEESCFRKTNLHPDESIRRATAGGRKKPVPYCLYYHEPNDA